MGFSPCPKRHSRAGRVEVTSQQDTAAEREPKV